MSRASPRASERFDSARHWRPLAAILLGVAIVTTAAVAVVLRTGAAEPGPEEEATAAANAFLDDYVDDSGRVVRTDQGGDTVSEGQAYGMLVAVGLRRRGAVPGDLVVDRGPPAARRRAPGVALGGRRGRRRARQPTPT